MDDSIVSESAGTAARDIGDGHAAEISQAAKLFFAFVPALIGTILLAGSIHENSATYDEVAYSRIACRWWRGGGQAEITRMGSPVTFWKWQAAPALAWLDTNGHGDWIDDPHTHLPQLLPWLRASSTWLWFLGLIAVQVWAWRAYGSNAGIFSGLAYVLGPNMRAHGALMTMETPLWTFVTIATMCLCERLRTGSRTWAIASAVAAGTAFSMKFTAVALPFLFAGTMACRDWFVAIRRDGAGLANALFKSVYKAARFGVGFAAVMVVTNLVLTGFARIEPSERTGRHPWLESRFRPAIAERLEKVLETPIPVDWVGFATQMRHQSGGGPGYLLGKTSNHGWPHYYLVALAVKCPPVVLVMLLVRPLTSRVRSRPEEWLIPLLCLAFLAVACVASKRNYGYRYLLPLAPSAIVWLSGMTVTRAGRVCTGAVVAALAWASLASHPYELTYFNAIADGRDRGHRVLADSNLDWGQGLIAFRQMLAHRPELSDTTLFYFGDIDPAVYGIGVNAYRIDASDRFGFLPARPSDCRTRFVAVSTSLAFGPWGPKGYFSGIAELEPVAMTADGTIRVYRNGEPGRTPPR